MKKIIVSGLVLSFLAAVALVAPSGVEAKAVAKNKNISNNSQAFATATDNDLVIAGAVNIGASVNTGVIAVANTGLNNQSGNQDGNVMATGNAKAKGKSSSSVNTTIVTVGD